ncbi:hypothetical protein B0H13DRAFT_2415189 [Mycena leptocephala]|nr:hypothetical protein B0H13DRAFT_1920322 [Mycena leptocephala]KAJ7841008.1 hypothetical protein B0H13DRAFT_2415189 [Mycena leptocephala]
MLPATAVSVKSAARWGIFVRRPGVHMACVEGGRGGLYIASGDHEGRHGGTRVNQRRGQVQNQWGGAFVRFAPFGGRAFAWHACVTQWAAAKVARDTAEPAQGQVRNQRRGSGFAFVCTVRARSHEDAFGRQAETGQGQGSMLDNGRRSLHNWGGTGGGTNTATFTLSVKAAGASALRREFALRGDIHNRRADGKAARVGGKSSGRLPTRSHGTRAGAEVSHHVGAGAGMKLAAQRAKAVRLAPSRSHRAEVRRGRFHRADAVVKATGASFGRSHGVCTFSFTFASAVTARISTTRRVEEVWARCICLPRAILILGGELFDRTWAAWGVGEVGAVCGRSRGCALPAAFDKNGVGRSKGDSRGTGENAQSRLLDGKGFGATAYIEDGGKSQVINGN